MSIFKLLTGLALIHVAASSLAQTDITSIENVTQELVKVRQQIENLHNEISYAKDGYKDQMRSYANEMSDLDVRISRADLNMKDLQRELKKISDINKEKNKEQGEVTPVLKGQIEQLRKTIERSLPFKLNQRINALAEIESRLDNGLISPNKAANQLWAFVEDELMLGKSSGIYDDRLDIGGQEKLVRVLRIGKVAMFHKTSDEQYGITKKVEDAWVLETYTNPESIAQLESLFDSFVKNIRNGQFVTPNFLPRS